MSSRQESVYINTSGRGLWSGAKKPVRILNIKFGYVEDPEGENATPQYAELVVIFDTKTWNTNKDGLIYTDPKFLKELQSFLRKHGLPGADVDYTEQGMQGRNYVSCGVTGKFIKSWMKKFGVVQDINGVKYKHH